MHLIRKKLKELLMQIYYFQSFNFGACCIYYPLEFRYDSTVSLCDEYIYYKKHGSIQTIFLEIGVFKGE